ncbi:hypothetical protein [Streptomyces boluensis]|uniref:Uncharacterized protein n=1 Tax=Streptomyces boluensis TaxID=1775135 RepID=A0A964XR60_9ACTN|nr:hypothetical protein [Streptomyces boluensis]NBE57036.1 hypothetical protein [Streptomyces boluensis]
MNDPFAFSRLLPAPPRQDATEPELPHARHVPDPGGEPDRSAEDAAPARTG